MEKYCPMLKQECKKEECAWYGEGGAEWRCAIFNISDSITELLVLMDDEYRGANINARVIES